MNPEPGSDEEINERSGAARLAPEPRLGGPSPGPRSTPLSAADRPTEERPAAMLSADPRTGPVSSPHPARPPATPPSVRTGPRAGDYRAGDPRAEPPVPTNIYRARRPGVAIALIIPAAVVGLLLIRSLAISAFGKTFLIGGVIASSLALASLPMIVAGLYGLLTGAAHGAEQWGFKVWARPPLAYLIVGIAFAAAAGLAIT